MKKNIFSIFDTKKVTGLYVGQETVDMVVLKSTIKGPKLIKFAQVPIYPKEKEEAEITPESGPNAPSTGLATAKEHEKKTRDDYIIEAIQKVFRESNIKPGNVVSAVPSEDAMVRYFQMPKIPKQEWNAAINFEAKRYIPFRMEDVASDFQVVSSRSLPNSMDVIFVAVKQNIIEKYANLLERAGLRPVIIEPAPLSLIRVFNAAEQIDDKLNTAIINIDVETANILILRTGVPYIIRDIPLDEKVSEGKSIEPVFERLLSEIKLSFDFYEKRFPSEVIDKIIIYSRMPLEKWHELVGKELQIPVEVGDPLRGISIKKGMVPPKLAVSFGLALRGISEPFIDLNLYKEKMLIYKRKELFIKTAFMEASLAVFLLIILKIVSMKMLAPLTGEFDLTLSERPKAELSIKKDSIDELESLKNKMATEKHFIENIIGRRTYFTTILTDLSELVPANIWLTEVNFEEKLDKKDVSKISRQLDIKGYCVMEDRAKETDIINNFLVDLQQLPYINKNMQKADIISVEKMEIEDRKAASFEILFSWP